MGARAWLVAISSAQFGAGLAGQLVALRDRRPFDVPLLGWRGSPERVARDSFLLGTGLSAPVVMLAAQAVATLRLAVGPSPMATRTLGALGAAMTLGYLAERQVRDALRPTGWDGAVTPMVVAGAGLSAVMAGIGLGGANLHGG